MSVALWMAQGLLAALFLAAGAMKMTRPHDKLAEQMGWPGDFSPGFLKLVGLLEVLGGLGLILPGITGWVPILTPIAASGLVLEQAVAGAVHIRRKEPRVIFGNVVLMVIAAFIAWGRFGNYPLQ
jgi:uncharacterized membrane protein YphA (DoxX/SURF4 family)